MEQQQDRQVHFNADDPDITTWSMCDCATGFDLLQRTHHRNRCETVEFAVR